MFGGVWEKRFCIWVFRSREATRILQFGAGIRERLPPAPYEGYLLAMTSRIRNAYDIRVEEGVITPEPAQAALIGALERLETDLSKKGLFGALPEVKGDVRQNPEDAPQSYIEVGDFVGRARTRA